MPYRRGTPIASWYLATYTGAGGRLLPDAPADFTPSLDSELALATLETYIGWLDEAPAGAIDYLWNGPSSSWATPRRWRCSSCSPSSPWPTCCCSSDPGGHERRRRIAVGAMARAGAGLQRGDRRAGRLPAADRLDGVAVVQATARHLYLATETVRLRSDARESYVEIFTAAKSFLVFIGNSLEIALIATLVAMTFGVTAAFALAKRRVGGTPVLSFLLLSFRMMPPVALILPYYLLFRATGLLGTISAIAITHAAFGIAVVIWMMRAFFEEIPTEIEDAATIDGATAWQLFRRITLPMSRPSIAAASIFALMTSWNEFIFAVVLSNTRTHTVPVAVSSFIGEVYVSWGELAAATTVGMLPTLVLAFIGQRYLLHGLTFGGLK